MYHIAMVKIKIYVISVLLGGMTQKLLLREIKLKLDAKKYLDKTFVELMDSVARASSTS